MTDRQPGHRWLARKSTLIAVLLVAVFGGGITAWYAVGQAPADAGAADPGNKTLVALGVQVYAKSCAACHGANLEGEKNWKQRKSDGTFGAPPHDASGHTWHHADALLFGITKHGGASVAPSGFKSGMPGFKDQLSDRKIWAVLAFIKSRWSPRERQVQERINAQSRR
ncbi:MAG TPA: c-type cytochrome [Alphaproteobacteria bacterium]|nr:c-type cytochrome [Alphaproteobacteria bacterium]